jgi:hypothetical protein
MTSYTYSIWTELSFSIWHPHRQSTVRTLSTLTETQSTWNHWLHTEHSTQLSVLFDILHTHLPIAVAPQYVIGLFRGPTAFGCAGTMWLNGASLCNRVSIHTICSISKHCRRGTSVGWMEVLYISYPLTPARQCCWIVLPKMSADISIWNNPVQYIYNTKNNIIAYHFRWNSQIWVTTIDWNDYKTQWSHLHKATI